MMQRRHTRSIDALGKKAATRRRAWRAAALSSHVALYLGKLVYNVASLPSIEGTVLYTFVYSSAWSTAAVGLVVAAVSRKSGISAGSRYYTYSK